ncbi:MAG: ABC transporter substrate binding protein [Spirochaetota bacterium]
MTVCKVLLALLVLTQIEAETKMSVQTPIPVLVSSNIPIYNKVIAGIKYSSQQSIQLFFLNQEEKQQLVKKINSMPSQTMVAIGNTASYFARENINKTTILAGTSYVRSKIAYSKGKSCGYLSDIAMDKYFTFIKKIHPQAKKILSFYSTEHGNYYSRFAESIDLQHGYIFTSKRVRLEDDFTKKLEEYAEGADAFFMVQDPLYNRENFEFLSKFTRDRKILLFSNLAGLTEFGVGFSLDIDYYETGVQTGKLLNQVISQKLVCNYGPYHFPQNELLQINKSYLKKAGFPVSKSLQTKTQIDYLNSRGVEMYYSGKKKTSTNIFQYVLSLDATNPTAQKYFGILNDEKYRDQIKDLLQVANGLFTKKRYLEAVKKYKKVLQINANVPGIREKIRESTFLASESKRRQAQVQLKRGKKFVAIKQYQDSLRISATNGKAKRELNNLRARLRTEIPSMHGKGLQLYNQRKYRQAIQVYENILLIDSSNKRAKEYLRLSRAKKDALDKLSNCKQDKDNPCSL